MMKVTQQQLQTFKGLFKMFDSDKNGIIDEEELSVLANKMGNPALKDLCLYLFSKNGKELTFDEASQFFAFIDKVEEDFTFLPRTLFKNFDSDKDGKINKAEFKKIVSLIVPITDEKIDEYFRKIDLDQNSLITYREFSKLF